MRCSTCIRDTFIFIIASVSLLITVDANSFLKANPASHRELVSEEDVQASLLAEVEGAFGSGTTSRLGEMETQLAPMFAALPKNERGYLGHATVRYALHRLFVQRHGWFIKGLHEAWGHRSSSGTAGLFKEQVPAYVQDMFEKRLNFRGYDLRELGVLAATIEHLIHNEAVNRLGKAYQTHGLLPTALMNESEVDDVLDTYMASYILGEDTSNMTIEELMDAKIEMPEVFAAWRATQKFVRGVREQITRTEQRASGTFEFSVVARVAAKVGEQFGSFQNHECRQIKDALVAKEESRTGRVRLSEFWRPALDDPSGAWQSTESLSYLRQLGVLDETDPHIPRVMIANYISSLSNCIASTSYYSVCCMNECEDLLGNLEKHIAAPEATPERIATFVASMSSSNVAPRVIPLWSRLEEIADRHGGVVQIHGRLFAQWMHHAFPRECPFPHVSGTTNPLTPDELESNGEESIATEEDMRDFISRASNITEQLQDDSLPWSPEEELLVARPWFLVQRVGATGAFIMASVIYTFLRAASLLPRTVLGTVPKKLHAV